jgi:hypothetical protein
MSKCSSIFGMLFSDDPTRDMRAYRELKERFDYLCWWIEPIKVL